MQILSIPEAALNGALAYTVPGQGPNWSFGMQVITSRSVEKSGTGLDNFGKTPNEKGSNELRLAHCIKRFDSRIAHYINLTDTF